MLFEKANRFFRKYAEIRFKEAVTPGSSPGMSPRL
jgi:hypothetical protein